MSKWIDRYLQQIRPDKTDKAEKCGDLSCLSVPTTAVSTKNEVLVKNTAGVINKSSSIPIFSNSKNLNNGRLTTDKPDIVWLKEVKGSFEALKIHTERKNALGHRVQIIRVLIRRFLNNKKCRKMVNYEGTLINDNAVEAYLDGELVNFDYDLEAMVEMYRIYTPQPTSTECQCGYRKPFCSCDGVPIPGIVTCNACEHFTPDQIGNGTGIGRCNVGVESTKELNGHRPLYRYSDRHCDKFSRLQN